MFKCFIKLKGHHWVTIKPYYAPGCTLIQMFAPQGRFVTYGYREGHLSDVGGGVDAGTQSRGDAHGAVVNEREREE